MSERTVTDRSIPSRLRRHRAKLSHTQADAAKHMGCTAMGVSNWECGRRVPRGMYRGAVLVYLGVCPAGQDRPIYDRAQERARETQERESAMHSRRPLANGWRVGIADDQYWFAHKGAEIQSVCFETAVRWGLLKDMRLHLGDTRADLTKKLGCGQSTVEGWEMGRAAPGPQYRDAVLVYLGVTT